MGAQEWLPHKTHFMGPKRIQFDHKTTEGPLCGSIYIVVGDGVRQLSATTTDRKKVTCKRCLLMLSRL